MGSHLPEMGSQQPDVASHQPGVGLRLVITLLVCLLSVMQPTVVESAPLDTANVSGRAADNVKSPNPNVDEVKQLEDLKQSLGKTFSFLKAHAELKYTDASGNQEQHVIHGEEAANQDGLLARIKQKMDTIQDGEKAVSPSSHVRTEIEIPSKGIHRVVEEPISQGQREVADNVERRSSPDISNHISNNILDSKYSSFSGVQYSPRDMAEYVFWTGDEKGVTLAIEEFLDDGVMTREEAITFLQEIKINLDYLQLHYSRQQRFHRLQDLDPAQVPSKTKAMMIEKALNSPRPMSVSGPTEDTFVAKKSMMVDVPSMPRMPPLPPMPPMQEEMGGPLSDMQSNLGLSEDDYEELLERLKVADFLYTEYSLEEVIYQLAKVMFTQSLSKGSSDARDALQKFTVFLGSEADKGHISRGLEKKVLDVLIASLADTLSEHPHMSAVDDGVKDTSTPSPNQLLQQLLMLNPAVGHAHLTPDSSNSNSVKGDQAGAAMHVAPTPKGRNSQESGNKESIELRKEKM